MAKIDDPREYKKSTDVPTKGKLHGRYSLRPPLKKPAPSCRIAYPWLAYS